MKIALVIAIVALAGCTTTIPVVPPNPYEFPASLLEDCKEPQFVDPEQKLSDNLKVMIDNNTKATECRVLKRALIESIKMRKDVYEREFGK